MWTVRLNVVPGLVNDKTVTIKGKLYAFDSLNADSEEECSRYVNVYSFDPASHQWHTLPVLTLRHESPMINCGRSVVAYGQCAYMWGGWHPNPRHNALFRFDTHSMTWSRLRVGGEVPEALMYNSACVLGNRMYIFGGCNSEVSGYVRFLDLDSLTWHRIRTSGEAPHERCAHTASAIGTRMYVWGGNLCHYWDNERYDNTLYYLETATATWVRPQVEGVAPQARIHHSAFVYDRELYIFGGYSVQLGMIFADMHKYNLVLSRWVEVTPNGPRPCARYFHGCSVLGERVFVLGGIRRKLNPAGEGHMEDDSDEEEDATDLHVLHFAPTLQNLCLLAVIDAGLDVSGLPEFIRNKMNALILRPS